MTEENTPVSVSENTDKKGSAFGKFLKWSGLLLLLLICDLTLIVLFRDPIIKSVVCSVGSKLTGTEISLQDFSSSFSGNIHIKGFSVSNPQGYSANNALSLKEVKVDINIASLFTPKKIINSISVRGMKVLFEGNFKENNFSKIQSNIQKFAPASSEEKEDVSQEPQSADGQDQKSEATENAEGSKAPQKTEDAGILIAKLDLEDAEATYINTALGQKFYLPLPPVHLKNIGGSNLQDIAHQLFSQLQSFISNTAVSTGKAVTGLLTEAGEGLNNSLQSAGKQLSEQTRKMGSLLQDAGKDITKSLKRNFNIFNR